MLRFVTRSSMTTILVMRPCAAASPTGKRAACAFAGAYRVDAHYQAIGENPLTERYLQATLRSRRAADRPDRLVRRARFAIVPERPAAFARRATTRPVYDAFFQLLARPWMPWTLSALIAGTALALWLDFRLRRGGARAGRP